jgi:alpha-L-fucosidase 2
MTATREPQDLVLAWPGPASEWTEAAPIGNGRLGAMIFGGIERCRLQINDSTIWSGTPDGPAQALAAVVAGGAGPRRLAEARQAIRNSGYRRAESLLMLFEGTYSQEYLPFADLWMSLEASGQAVYRGRTLNLDNGIAAEEMTLGGRTVRRLAWASRPAQAICVAVTVDGRTVDMRLALSSPLRTAHRAAGETGLVLGVEIPVDGAPRHEADVAEPLRYADNPVGTYDPFGAVAVAIDTDGQVAFSDGEWSVRGMSRALVTLASSTSAGDVWSNPPGRAAAQSRSRAQHLKRAARQARSALAEGADGLCRAHQEDLRALLGRTSLVIGSRRGGTADVAELLSGADERLVATVMFQLGRYLLASASRPGGGPPANLQGIWNADLRPAWSSNYTLNINTEMNYWGSEPAGLSECHEPLFDLIERLAYNGRQVCRELYGTRGWVAHHNTDMWGWALPAGMGHGAPSWAIWMMGGVWLTQHLWDHFEFSNDTEFLRERGWPLLRGCAEFCLDWLVDGEDGWLDTVPSTSPENLFLTPGGTPEALSYSTSMDMALIRALFTHCLQAAGILGLSDPVCQQIRDAIPRLRPPGVTGDGRLREWAEDYAEQDPAHRHISPMVAVYPLGQIDPDQSPDLAAAARRLLDSRGPGAMGWSWAWKIALRARLGDASTARDLLLEATRPFTGDPHTDAPVDGSRWGGLLPSLLSTHPPFQIDGNYGFTAAIAEMVVQSHGGVIRVLPAVPAAWPDGRARGLRCRGGLAVDIGWHGGELTFLTIRRLHDGREPTVRVRYGRYAAQVKLRIGEEAHLGPGLSGPLTTEKEADGDRRSGPRCPLALSQHLRGTQGLRRFLAGHARLDGQPRPRAGSRPRRHDAPDHRSVRRDLRRLRRSSRQGMAARPASPQRPAPGGRPVPRLRERPRTAR